MADQEQSSTQKRAKLWRYLAIPIILGLAAYLLIPQITALEHSWGVIQNLTGWAIALAALAQLCSWLGSGLILHSILAINRQKLPVWKGAIIAIATLSLSVSAGGAVGLAALVSWIHRENHEGHTAALAGMLPAFLNTGTLAGVAIIGTTYLLLVHALSNVRLSEFVIVLLVLGLITAGELILLRFSKITTRFVVWLAGFWANLRRKPFKPEETIVLVNQFFAAWNSMRRGKWLRPLMGAFINIGFDMLTLYFFFIAAGYKISAGVLFAGYGLPIVLGKMAFMFPGGIGVVEGSMVALFNKLQVPNSISAVAITGYRLFSFWLPTLFGFVAAAYLSGKLFSPKKEKE